MTPRTADEIAKEIHDLKALKPQLKGQNLISINAQIRALQTYMTPRAAHDAWDAETQLETLSGALEAVEWRLGKQETAPSKEWGELLE